MSDVQIEPYYDSTVPDLRPLIGKAVKSIFSSEYRFEITFDDGTVLKLIGGIYENSNLEVEIS